MSAGNTGGNFRLAMVGMGAILVLAAPAAAAETPTFSKDVAPILPGQVPGVPSAELDRADVAHHLPGSAAVGALDQGARRDAPDAAVAHRPSVGVQKFKNDMSLTDEQIDTIVALGRRRRAAGRSEGHAAAQAARRPTTSGRASATASARPTSSSSRRSTRCRPQHQDVWWRPMCDIPITEPRWVKMVEIRPTNLKARKIVHHSIAYLVLNRRSRRRQHRHRATAPIARRRRRPRSTAARS